MHSNIGFSDRFTQKALLELAQILAKLNSLPEIEAFLSSLLTRRELQDIANRWWLVKLLYMGKSQRFIAAQMGLSLCKITRGSRELKKESSIFRRVLDSNPQLIPEIKKNPAET